MLRPDLNCAIADDFVAGRRSTVVSDHRCYPVAFGRTARYDRVVSILFRFGAVACTDNSNRSHDCSADCRPKTVNEGSGIGW
jgi:hypothetical protein